MKIAIRCLIPGLALLAAAAPVSIRAAAAPQVVERTEKAIVKGTTVAVDKTKEGLSKTGEVMTDEWITTRIHERFVGEDLLKGSDISVDTSKHVVTLKGTVLGRDGRARAERVAVGTEGVRRVVNNLIVGPKRKA